MSLNSMFTCDYCGRKFTANFTLRRHVRSFHKDGILPVVPRGRKPKVYQKDLTCLFCNEQLVNKKALIYHRKIKHPPTKNEQTESLLRRTLQFKTVNDFLRWKTCEEDATVASFVKVRGDYKQRATQATLRVYKCNRSGRYVGKGRQLRHLKIQGSCKTDCVCPAAMFVRIFLTGGVMVSYYPEHKGHEFEMVHCRKPSHPLALPNIPELDVFSSNIASSGETCILQQHLTAAESAWICIRNAMESDLTIAQVALEHMVKLKNILTALLNKQETSQASQDGPSNKSKAKQASSRFRPPNKGHQGRLYEPRLIAPKPTLLEADCVLNLLDGCQHVISHEAPVQPDYSVISHQAPVQRDYSVTSRAGIDVEHSYVAAIQLL